MRFIPRALVVIVIAGLAIWWQHRRNTWRWDLPPGFPMPVVPADNPMSIEKVELGRRLFYDKRLSSNDTQSCASCHQQEKAFTDGRAHAIGCTGEINRRGAPSLANVAYLARLTWANPLLDRLEDQALLPTFGDTPHELALPNGPVLIDRLKSDADYRERFSRAFSDGITVANAMKAIACFERTLISGRSKYDRYANGDTDALSPSELRGMELFFSERLECFHCHGGFDFADSMNHVGLPEPQRAFHNTGLYDVDGKGTYPKSDRGLIEITGRPEDMGKFKAPTLRNVAVTAPYMHDGSVATLNEAIDHYARGGRTQSPLKEAFVGGFVLTDDEKHDLIAFLNALTDEQFLTDKRFSDPFSPSR